ncbi:TPR and ankyrin repeat-containing protein 1 isoform X3 [Macrotis lagotis]|uniref:TPR and ankyrin repeat-containing protein 1 isoform X3 n=1 Tax=Macrotis lagotis TaxID=92651 RepID=UPI003D6831C3
MWGGEAGAAAAVARPGVLALRPGPGAEPEDSHSALASFQPHDRPAGDKHWEALPTGRHYVLSSGETQCLLPCYFPSDKKIAHQTPCQFGSDLTQEALCVATDELSWLLPGRPPYQLWPVHNSWECSSLSLSFPSPSNTCGAGNEGVLSSYYLSEQTLSELRPPQWGFPAGQTEGLESAPEKAFRSGGDGTPHQMGAMDPTTYAEYLKESGNQIFKSGNFSLAIRKYDEAIQVLLHLYHWPRQPKPETGEKVPPQARCWLEETGKAPSLRVPPRDLAVLLCNKSNAFYNLGKWNEAFYAAKESLQWDPSYVKGYYRAGYSLLQLLQPYEAAQMFLEGLRILQSSPDQVQISDLIVGIFTTISGEHVILRSFLPFFEKIFSVGFDASVWQAVIEKLAKKGLWHSFLLLSTKKDKLPCDLRVPDLSLKGLFEKYVLFGHYEKMEQMPKLVQWLISLGASVQSIGPYPLHAIMKLCIQAKENHLFRWLMDQKPELRADINQTDADGCTVLHIVASHCAGYLGRRQTEDVQMLLYLGIDPTIVDKQARCAIDILKRNKNFKAVDKINSFLDSRKRGCAKGASGQNMSDASLRESHAFLDILEPFIQYLCTENRSQQKGLLKHEVVQRFLRLLSTIQVLPPHVVCEFNHACASAFIRLLLEKQKWHEVLLLLTGKANDESSVADGLIKNCNFSDLDIRTVIQHLSHWDRRRIYLLGCLIDCGAPTEGLNRNQDRERPLTMCLKSGDYQLAFLLLSKGADPRGMTLTEGDMPLHVALFIYLDKRADIGLTFLSHLLDLYSSSPSDFHFLSPNAQDANGNTVMHIIFQKGMLKRVKRVMDLLARFDINFNLKNKEGKDVRHRIKKNDMLLVTWNKAVMENRRKGRLDLISSHPPRLLKELTASPTQQQKSATLSPGGLGSQLSLGDTTLGALEGEGQALNGWERGRALPASRLEAEGNKPFTLRDSLVQAIIALIQQMELGSLGTEDAPASPKPPRSGEEGCPEDCTVPEDGKSETPGEKPSPVPKVEVEEVRAPPRAEPPPPLVNGEEEGGEGAEEEPPVQELEAYLQDFDNMTWEIECTSEMLKKLASKAVTQVLKKKIVLAIQHLGNGEWTQGLQKRLRHLRGDIQLYEAKLDKGARMLWELAIDFSPRCSENPEKIIATARASHPLEKSGGVYTEIIRIWDIVLDHCKLNDAIKAICAAYNRGLSCILRKKLKGIHTGQLSSGLKIQKRIPRCYVEDKDAANGRGRERMVPEYFPPASAVATEYNIMKFHSFSTSMALNIISDSTAPAEYPFRVGELEYAVIDLNPRPLEPIILIGRSGTGKTTCCLYRLWKRFHSYWDKAARAGSPLLAKHIWHHRAGRPAGAEEEEVVAEDADADEDEDEEEGPPPESETADSIDEDPEDESSSSGPDPDPPGAVESTDEAEPSQLVRLEHLRQVFVTKNHVLCQEVQRNFVELTKSSKATSHFRPLEPSVHRLQDVKDESFPLFVTSRQLLLLLDASLPNPFFLRNEDGSLKRNILGWSMHEESAIPNWQEDDEAGDGDGDYGEEDKTSEAHGGEKDPRVFVTYEVFANEMWSKMVKGKTSYNPALVWKEIKSFLKGSFEALSCPQGKLTEEAYQKLGRKRSPNFKEDRGEIYALFCLYQRIRSQKGYFDEEDVLYNLSQRLSKLHALPWSIHELYGDEIQDFTQAELTLLMRCINDPNAMFLTGDTAQSIMKGVAFRFSDLRSLFHYASKNCVDKKRCPVRKPKRIYQLYQNYRSHSGILNLASGVVDLLQFYFPESFDRLPRDAGLFDGPKPTVLESCSVSDLAILLRGNKRKTQPIEFGAHQVILVANDVAKEKIPEELGLALVLTIYEAKGLEFDDVLLYNFFTDSEAYKEWKIISSFTPSSEGRNEENRPLVEVSLERMHTSPSRPQLLNVEAYKLLNGELKQLYTAITRARVNLWIFDENRDKRAPAFRYFIRRDLVQVVKTDENKDFDDSMFVKTSTPEEWIVQGDYYAKHQCWKVAAKCYQKGAAFDKEKLALAHDAVLNVKSKKVSPKEKQMEYLELAKTYLECGEPKLSLKCLGYAREFQLSGLLCEKLGKIKDAAYFYKRSQCYKDAFRCFEQIQEFDLALKMYCQEGLFEEAAQAVEKFEEMLRAKMLPMSKLSYSASQFYLEAAAKYLSLNKTKEMMSVLSKLDTEDQLVFLKSRKCLAEAAALLKGEGRREEAALLMKQHGFLLEASRLTKDKDFQASCLLEAARLKMAWGSDGEDTKVILKEALALCHQTGQRAGIAEAYFLQGILLKDFLRLKVAFYKFIHLNQPAGAVEALYEAMRRCRPGPDKLLALAPGALELLLHVVRALKRVTNNAEREMVKSCFEFFGISQVDVQLCQVSQSEPGPVLKIIFELNPNLREKKPKESLLVAVDSVKLALTKHLLARLCEISRGLLAMSYPAVCLRFMAGLSCKDPTCEDFHRPLRRCEAWTMVQSHIHLVALNGLLLEAKRVFPKMLAPELEEIDYLLTTDAYSLCKALLAIVFPRHFHQRILSENLLSCREMFRPSYSSLKAYRSVLKEYVHFRFRQEQVRNQRESTDLWLGAMQALVLASSYPEEFERLLHQVEDDYGRELHEAESLEAESKDWMRAKVPEGRWGMLLPHKDTESAEKTHLCFVRLLQSSLEHFYLHRNPEDCKRLFFRFMNVLVRRCKEPLLPTIGHTLALLEFQFVHCGAVLVRLWKGAALRLPRSYISLIHFWDYLFGKRDEGKELGNVFTIIQDYKPKDTGHAIRDFRFHLAYLARVLCGCENGNFNVLLDAFRDVGHVASGEAERAIVLCLVMLINIGAVVRPCCKPILCHYFPEIEARLKHLSVEFPSEVPERLLRVIDRVMAATDVKAVAEALQDLLYERDEEFLLDCYWHWDPGHGKGPVVRGLYFEEINLHQLVCLHPAEAFVVELEAEFDCDESTEDREDVLASILFQKRRKALQKLSTRRKLRRVCLVVSLCIQWRRRACAKMEPSWEDPHELGVGNFKRADIDRTQCDLCGVKFTQGPENDFSLREALEGEASDAVMSVEAEPEDKDVLEGSPDFKVSESYEEHVCLEAHQKKHAAYQRYLEFFSTRVDPAIGEGKLVVRNIEQSSWTESHLGSHEHSRILQRKILENIKRVSDAVEDVYRRKAWADAEETMTRLVNILTPSVSDAREWLVKTEDRLKEEGIVQENEYENDVEDFGELRPKRFSKKRGWRRRY